MIYAQIAQGKQVINLQDNKKYESKIFFNFNSNSN
jgi:hypothetical protein